ncbi:GNAT family N-acetyltransferase [Glycomyces paridis]|nr:GNAT family N-acetyltransferase [Glycomyces paridis]
MHTPLEILPVDPGDTDAWIAMRHAVERHDAPGEPLTNPALTRLGLLSRGEYHRFERLLARVGDEIVGDLGLELALQDNQHLVEVHLRVHPEHRRRGVGTALLAHAERRAAELGRDTLVGYTSDHVEGGADFDRSGPPFALARGYEVVDQDLHNRCDLDAVGEEVLTRRFEEAWTHAAGYELVQSTASAVADDLVEGIAYLCERMYTDMPLGEALDLRPADVDAARIREYERSRAASGQSQVISAVRHVATGVVVGYTFIRVDPGEERHAWQDDTIVLPEHRGHRLGLILKIANQRQLRRFRPQMRYVHTWNAEANGPMVDINTAIGYWPLNRVLVVQKKLA